MLKEVRVNTLEINEIENFSKEVEDTKQNQVKILKLKNVRTKKKKKPSLDKLNSKLKVTKTQ